MAIADRIPSYSDDLKYLMNSNSYQEIINNSDSPLLIQRAEYYLNLLHDSKKLEGTLTKHEQNIDWNLTRIYRFRNEIVHNAASKPNIITVTSHLRYYLIFIMNSIIDFFIKNQNKYNSENQLSIDNYFLLQDIIYKSLNASTSGFSFENLLAIENPLEVFVNS